MLGEKYLSENESLKSLVPQFSKGDICLLDRGFHGKSLWLQFKDHKQYFIARYKSSKIGRWKEFDPKKRDQTFVTTDFRSGRKIKLRIIKVVTNKNKRSIYLITNLLSSKKYTRKELSAIYLKRQVVEEGFKQMKKNLSYKLEYRAKKINSVLQEVFASMLALSITSIFRASKQGQVPAKKVISFVGTSYVLKEFFGAIFFKEYDKELDYEIHRLLESHFHYRQKNRSFPRYSKQAPRKWTREKRLKKYRENNKLRA